MYQHIKTLLGNHTSTRHVLLYLYNPSCRNTRSSPSSLTVVPPTARRLLLRLCHLILPFRRIVRVRGPSTAQTHTPSVSNRTSTLVLSHRIRTGADSTEARLLGCTLARGCKPYRGRGRSNPTLAPPAPACTRPWSRCGFCESGEESRLHRSAWRGTPRAACQSQRVSRGSDESRTAGRLAGDFSCLHGVCSG